MAWSRFCSEFWFNISYEWYIFNVFFFWRLADQAKQLHRTMHGTQRASLMTDTPATLSLGTGTGEGTGLTLTTPTLGTGTGRDRLDPICLHSENYDGRRVQPNTIHTRGTSTCAGINLASAVLNLEARKGAGTYRCQPPIPEEQAWV